MKVLLHILIAFVIGVVFVMAGATPEGVRNVVIGYGMGILGYELLSGRLL